MRIPGGAWFLASICALALAVSLILIGGGPEQAIEGDTEPNRESADSTVLPADSEGSGLSSPGGGVARASDGAGPDVVPWSDEFEGRVVERMNVAAPGLVDMREGYRRLVEEARATAHMADYPFVDLTAMSGLSPMAEQVALAVLLNEVERMNAEGTGFPGGSNRNEDYYRSVLDSRDVFVVPITGLTETPYFDGRERPDTTMLQVAQQRRAQLLREYATVHATRKTVAHLAKPGSDLGPADVIVDAEARLASLDAELARIRRRCAVDVLSALGATRLPDFADSDVGGDG